MTKYDKMKVKFFPKLTKNLPPIFVRPAAYRLSRSEVSGDNWRADTLNKLINALRSIIAAVEPRALAHINIAD